MFTKKTKLALVKGIITKETPIYVQFAITKHCNLNCGACASSLSRKNERELSLSEIEKISVVLSRLGAGIILLTGGEPFLRKDLPEIISAFCTKGFTVRLQTNGILANEERIMAALQAGMLEITVSLNSLTPEKHDSMVGLAGSWQRTITAIARFSQILPKRGAVLGINTIVSPQNLSELPAIIKFVTAIGFHSSLIPVHTAPADKEDFIIRKYAPEYAFHSEAFLEIDRVYTEIIKMKKQGYRIYNSFEFLRNSPVFLKGKRVEWRCDSPNLYFAISPSGNFLPCVELKTAYSMLDDGFVERYNSKEFKKEVGDMVTRCTGCYYACWPEMTYLCRNPLVFGERAIFGLRAAWEKRRPVTYERCLEIRELINSGGVPTA